MDEARGEMLKIVLNTERRWKVDGEWPRHAQSGLIEGRVGTTGRKDN